MRGHTDWENFFQVPEQNWDHERKNQTLLLGQRIFERVAEDRHLIPESNLIEIPYDSLCGNELEHLRRIWEQFDLPGWSRAERNIKRYLGGIAGYRENQLEISEQDRDAVYTHWRASFDTYGYDPTLRL